MEATISTQAEASRLNGQKSQGPITEEGKANSSRNSFKHGLYAKNVVLNEEDAAALESLRQDLRAEHQPRNTTEGMLVEELAMNYWSINRYRTLEANALNNNAAFSLITGIHRFLTAAQRAFHRVLKELQSLKKLAKQPGFVPQNLESQPQPVKSAAPPAAAKGFPSTRELDLLLEDDNWLPTDDMLPAGIKEVADKFRNDYRQQFIDRRNLQNSVA